VALNDRVIANFLLSVLEKELVKIGQYLMKLYSCETW